MFCLALWKEFKHKYIALGNMAPKLKQQTTDNYYYNMYLYVYKYNIIYKLNVLYNIFKLNVIY